MERSRRYAIPMFDRKGRVKPQVTERWSKLRYVKAKKTA